MKPENWDPHHDLPQACKEVNMYVQFVYSPYTICNHTWGHISWSVNADPGMQNTQVNNQQKKYCVEKLR